MDILKNKVKPLLLKCLGLMISAAILFSVCVVGININTSAAGAENQFWSGNTVSGYADFEGKGTDKEPYLIKTPEQLAFAVGKNPALGDHIYYKLANDIKINDTSKTNWEASAKSWKRYDHARFGGVLDGDGHTIDGLYISTNTTTGRYGFISYIGGPKNGSYVAEVKNLKFTNASINHTATSTANNLQGMAVVAGQTSGKVIFEKIYVDETCKVNAPKVKGVAGIAGRGYDNGNNADPTIKNCTVLATITGNSHVGAIVGSYWAADANVTIEKCFAVTNTGLVGAKSNATVSITDTYTTTLGTLDTGATQVNAENMKGENAKTYMPNLDFENVWQTVEGGYPVLKFAANNTPSSTPAWDGTAAESYAGGLGTQESPWEIETAAQLFKMVKENTTVNTDAAFAEMKYFKITKDIVINPVTAEDMVNPTVAAWDAKGYKTWNPGYTGNQNSNGFYGVVDGGGHTISGLYVKEGQYVGLIPVIVDNASITNIKVTNSFVRASSGSASPGIIVGIVYGKKNNYPTFDLTYSSIDNCYVLADATGSWRIGGLVGGAYDAKKITISDCSATNLKMYTTNTGTVGRTGAFIGNVGGGNHVVKNCFTDASTHPVSNTTDTQTNYDQLHKFITWTNVYTAAAKPSFDKYNDITYLTADQMKGENAKTNMTGLNFETVFQTVENDYPIINVREPAVPPTAPLWDGTKDSNLEGEGTEEKPYLIKTPEQLAYVVATDLPDGKYFKLANDIRIHDTTKANWKESALNWPFGNVRFTGTFDGDGHTIEGLYYKGKQQRMGLFSYVGADNNGVYETTIKNFKLSGAYIENDNTGAGTKLEGTAFIAPQTQRSTTFEHIYIDETCTLVAKNFKGVAGIAARGSSDASVTVTVNECAMLGKIETTDCSLVGAFFGTYWRSATVLNINGSFTSSDKPITGEHALGAAANNYAVTADTQGTNVVTVDQMKGLAAETNMSGLNFETTWKAVENGFPVIDLRDTTPPPPVPDYVWDGTKADSFAGGDGSEDTPFLIENAEQLYKMVVEYSNRAASAGKYFKITKDIYINNVESGNTLVSMKHKKNWLDKYGTEVPTASKDNSFCGILDGGFHKIYGLYVTGVKSAGLFPSLTSGVEIKNLAFDNLYITGGSGTAGALAGQVIYADWTKANKISNCSVVNATIGEGGNIESVGGLIGDTRDNSITFTNCYSHDVSLSDWKTPGGIVGYAWSDGNKVTLVTCYSIGYFPVRSDINKVICTDVYSDTAAPTGNTTEGVTVLANAKFKGDVAKDNLNNFDFDRIWKVVENGYPEHFEYKRPANVWDGKTAESFAGGSGTPYDPYLIENGAQLYKMVKEYSNASGASGSVNKQTYFKLISDIYLNDINENDMINPTVAAWNSKFNTWYTCTSYSKGFCGELDGDGYTVYGLYSNTGYSGLIPNLMDGGSVHNLNLKNSYIRGTESAGTIVGFVKAHWKMAPVSVSYCTVDNVVIESTKKYVGGIIGGFGDIKITVNDCGVTNAKFRTTDEFADYATGIIGVGWGELTQKVSNCFTDSTLSPATYIAATSKYKVEYTNVYTSSAKKGSVKGITYLANDGKLQGKNVASVLKGFNFKEDWSATDTYPVIKKNAGLWRYDNTRAGQVWSGKLARYYASGDGTKASPYEIKTGGQLALLANDALNGKTTDKYYKITADIRLNNTAKEDWQKTANEWFTGTWAQAFRGKLNGNYHIISGLYLNKTKDTYDGTHYYGGLFAVIGQGAVIEKLGIVDSSLTFNFTKHSSGGTHLGTFAGFVDQYDAKKAKFSEYPLISECFADTSVYLDGKTTGGIVGDATRPVRVENSFFTGHVKSTSRGLFGYSKMNNDYGVVLVKNFYAADSKYAILSNVSYDNFIYENCYASSSQDTNGVTRLFIDRMCGEEALKYMTGLDFEKIWVVRAADETPGLKGFDQKKYSNVMSPEDITVSFETNCDLEVKSITGKAYSKIELPVLEREGYTFEGWYTYPELDTPFTYDYFPTFDTILYAKWSINGYMQDFEQYENTVYDYHEGLDYFRPTSVGYSSKYVHGGGKAMHRLEGGSDYRDFLVFYKEELEVGKTYKMVYYTTTDSDKASVDMSLVHLEWPDVYSANKGVKKMDKITGLTDGEWVENTYTFTAKSKWIAIRTAGNASIYVDDVAVFELDGGAALAGFFGSVWGIITIVFAAVVLLASGAVAFLFIRKRK